MCDELISHINKTITLDKNQEDKIRDAFRIHLLKKKENIMQGDAICRNHFFVMKGCMRMFFINDKGIETTIQFALENWWITDYMAFQQQKKTIYTIQAIEKSEIAAISFEQQEKLLNEVPGLEKYFRLIYQRAAAASQVRIRHIYDLSKEDMYKMFSENFPGFVQRIPQYLLASYLGFTPEYLSEIRKKLLS